MATSNGLVAFPSTQDDFSSFLERVKDVASLQGEDVETYYPSGRAYARGAANTQW